MQRFYSITDFASKFRVTSEAVSKFLESNGQKPALSIDGVPHFTEDVHDFIQDDIKRELRIRQLEKSLGYSDLNEILYPDKSGACRDFGPLERFVETFGERPHKDYSAELAAATDGNERAWIGSKSWQSGRYWEEVEDLKNAVRGEK